MTQLASHEVTKLGCYKDFDSESTDVACFGFSDTEQKWYGWSHRSFIGFGIGYVAKRGEVAVDYGKKKPLKVYKFVGDDDIRCGDGLAIVAAENDSQARRLMDDAAKGDITDADGYNIQNLVSTLDTINPIEIPCLSASLSEPTIIAIRAYEE